MTDDDSRESCEVEFYEFGLVRNNRITALASLRVKISNLELK